MKLNFRVRFVTFIDVSSSGVVLEIKMSHIFFLASVIFMLLCDAFEGLYSYRFYSSAIRSLCTSSQIYIRSLFSKNLPCIEI